MKIDFNNDPKIPFPPSNSQPSGFSIAAKTLTHHSPEEWRKLNRIAAEIRKDPLKMQKLADRIYSLMQQDLQANSERSRGFKHPY
jgi:hypothetical protein